MPPYATGLETRERLLAAAAEVFAEQGYRHAKAIDVCRRAGTTPAAVNYHFGDKEQLYLEVIRWANERREPHAAWKQVDPAAAPAEQLRQFVHGFLMNILDPDRAAWQTKLMAREMVEPTAALDVLVQQAVRPLLECLEGIVARILGPGASGEELRWCAGSVIGQCMLYNHSRAVVARMAPEMQYDGETIAALADHITRFSLAGIEALAGRRGRMDH